MPERKDEELNPIPQRDLPPHERQGYEALGEYSNENEGDRMIIARLVELGSDLSNPRHIVHYLYFQTLEGRLAAQTLLAESGYQTRFGLTIETDVHPWSLIAERNGILNEDSVSRERSLMNDIAEKQGGYYDGWEAQTG
jgi:regulator of RNase E activity RraB